MSNSALDPDMHDSDLEEVQDSVDSELAFLTYINSWLDHIVRSATLQEAKGRAATLSSRVQGRADALRGEAMRLRTPDS